MVEAQGDVGRRYFKAYLAERLGGEWRSLAAEKQKVFASMANVAQPGERWTDSIGRGELIRAGYNQELAVNPKVMIFFFKV